MSTLDARVPVYARATPRSVAAVREVALIGSTFLLYELGRHLVGHRGALAFTDAGSVVSAERALHLPSETVVQHALLSSQTLVRAANVFYVSVHFPATIAFLVWMWLYRPQAYAWARSLLVSVTLAAFVLHVTFPLAPPRMLPGFIDTMAVYGPSAYGEGTQSVTNQYAAMPSLHAAWALIIAITLVVSLSSRWRWLAVLHPALTVGVIVGTGNHYWLDVVAAAALVLLALGVHGVAPRDGQRRAAPAAA